MGTVHLVGAGPGDPELVTRRGEALLRRADVVLHDALVDPRILAWAPARAEIVDVGRRAGESRRLDQAGINRLLIARAREHAVVVRLKGGDPFVFGRGGEEALALAEASIPFEVVPGVTSGVGALACAGIPLTHRGVTGNVLFATPPRGHGAEAETEWRRIAGTGGTLVLYMAGHRLAETGERLMRHGRDRGEPAALVEWGTLPRQRVVVAPLAHLHGRVGGTPGGPVLLVVGEVVGLRERIGWWPPGSGGAREVGDALPPSAPLTGRTVLLARARAQPSRIAARLERMGASVLEFPTVHIVETADTDRAAAAVAAHVPDGVVVFTGASAVRVVARALRRAGTDARSLAGAKLVGIGGETVDALRASNLGCDVPVRTYRPGQVLRLLRRRAGPLHGRAILLVRDGPEASPIGSALAAAGAMVTALGVAERTLDDRGRRNLERSLAAGEVDWVVLPSSSAAEAMVSTGLTLSPDVPVVAIGPSTATTARRLGFPEPRVPEGPGVAGMMATLEAAASRTAAPGPPPPAVAPGFDPAHILSSPPRSTP